MVWLSDGEKILKIRLFILIESTNVTDGRTDRHARQHRQHSCIESRGNDGPVQFMFVNEQLVVNVCSCRNIRFKKICSS